MAIVTVAGSGLRQFSAHLDIDSPAEDAFTLLCAVEKWPVWLSFLRSASLARPAEPLALGSEVLVRSSLPGHGEQLYEVDQFTTNFHLSLVGAYSVRRRIDFRIEHKSTRSRLHVKFCYPSYHGKIGAALDQIRHGRRVSGALDEALVHFKALSEYRAKDEILADF